MICASTLVFNPGLTHVALVLKNRPDFLKNKLTAIGGRLEEGEHAVSAATRELLEEAGLDVVDVNHFATTNRPRSTCYMFWAIALLQDVQSLTDEPVSVWDLDSIRHGDRSLFSDDLLWLIEMALSSIHGNESVFEIEE